MKAAAVRPSQTKLERDRTALQLGRALGRSREVLFAFGLGSYFAGLPYRDVDVAVFPTVETDFTVHLAQAWARACREAVGMPVDVVNLRAAPLTLRHAATQGPLLYTADPAASAAFMERTWRRYCDFEPFMRRQLRDLMTG